MLLKSPRRALRCDCNKLAPDCPSRQRFFKGAAITMSPVAASRSRFDRLASPNLPLPCLYKVSEFDSAAGGLAIHRLSEPCITVLTNCNLCFICQIYGQKSCMSGGARSGFFNIPRIPLPKGVLRNKMSNLIPQFTPFIKTRERFADLENGVQVGELQYFSHPSPGRIVSVVVCCSIGVRSKGLTWQINPIARERLHVTLLALLDGGNRNVQETYLFPYVDRQSRFEVASDSVWLKRGTPLKCTSQFLEALKTVSRP
jgi:hypothetical protein